MVFYIFVSSQLLLLLDGGSTKNFNVASVFSVIDGGFICSWASTHLKGSKLDGNQV